MKFILNMTVDNEAFQPTPYTETARLLRAIADRIETIGSPNRHCEIVGDYRDAKGGWAGHFQTLLDQNGNDVGRYAFKPDDYK